MNEYANLLKETLKSRIREMADNLLHLNAAYDLCNSLYVDAIVQPRMPRNEGRALATMVDRFPIEGKTIVIADRGYESSRLQTFPALTGR